jgi:7-carboxy-7-deazaguanine synthase
MRRGFKGERVMIKVTETFVSVQGEGSMSGELTFFIRLAGCNVGRPREDGSPYFQCSAIDGTDFVCDTNFRARRSMTVEELLEEFYKEKAPAVCVTGGEPMLQIEEIVPALRVMNKTASISMETSGTISLATVPPWVYVICSPKRGFKSENLSRPDEFKLMIDDSTNLEVLEKFLDDLEGRGELAPVFLMPVNAVTYLNRSPLDNCMKLLRKYPNCRLGIQMHKAYGLR